jgi:hypothetical protein
MAFSKTLTKRQLPLAAGHIRVKNLFQPFQPFNRCAEPVLSKVEGFKSLKDESVPDVSMIGAFQSRDYLFVFFTALDIRRHDEKEARSVRCRAVRCSRYRRT